LTFNIAFATNKSQQASGGAAQGRLGQRTPREKYDKKRGVTRRLLWHGQGFGLSRAIRVSAACAAAESNKTQTTLLRTAAALNDMVRSSEGMATPTEAMVAVGACKHADAVPE
jgi:hypothetical protein